ncbi:ATP-binding protein [Geothermobacter hydrogeniphilus]|uniref:ATP-binding protein n=1 Tax=Geothermobacter hydrogeniphilus TaxID=1969733 RepID=A0A2K2H8W6_9BACT|nr:ATP-binding protein [Geothermobacter hydrogeniphilus]PNU19711.1 ATP-binding protein [Geothermobacter hydrogeniphilus]
MSQAEPSGLFFAREQYRLCRLQVYNWGTFSGLHDIPIAEDGFLFVGRSGSGKSTLLDAISTLLVPPRWIDFNAAAREADKTGRDRNLVSYIRGAWAEQKEESSGEIATRFLRRGTTWSALALSYRRSDGHMVVLNQLMWLRGNANGNSDVRRQYLIHEQNLDLRELEFFGQSNFDVRKLKQAFPGVFIRGEFRPYCERFCRLFGIENEMALRLLHKTQSAKNLGDLNSFLREFMLDKPATFTVAERLVSEFDELSAAHQAVVTARQQVETLSPARDRYQQHQTLRTEIGRLEDLRLGLDPYCELQRQRLLNERLVQLRVEEEGLRGEEGQLRARLEEERGSLRELEQRHRDSGGGQLEAWRQEQTELESQRNARLRHRGSAEEACRKLGWQLAEAPAPFAEQVGQARRTLESWEIDSRTLRGQRDELVVEKQRLKTDFAQVREEIQALERQPSNIPARMLALRREVCEALGIAEGALPFVGELLEVKPDQADWRGAIERVLHGFALSLLVEERHYAALSNHLNTRHLGQRLVYYRCGRIGAGQQRPLAQASLVLKLQVKDCPQREWLSHELRRRFDYACVDSLQEFRREERALTREGQVKHNRTRHEKDDRHPVDDSGRWVLGFDNRAKLALFQERARQVAGQLATLNDRLAQLDDAETAHSERMRHCQTLVNLQWQDIDALSLTRRIERLAGKIAGMLSQDHALQDLARQIEGQQQKLEATDEALRATLGRLDRLENERRDNEQKLIELRQGLEGVVLTPGQEEGLVERYALLKEPLRLDNLDRHTKTVLKGLHEDLSQADKVKAEAEKFIEKRFDEFIHQWSAEAEGLDADMAAAEDFFAKLTRLETDGLPAHEQRFFELLQNQSHQNLAALSTYLNDARKAILERMELVNESLVKVPFNQQDDRSSFLHIDAQDRQLVEVREFKREIKQVLKHAWNEDRAAAEQRFTSLRGIVERLASQEPDAKRWRQLVLDVRLHVEFIGREIDASGVEIEVYRSGTGKSGGQRQKLATTCLAAALRYQLGGDENGVPMYAPVVLDEAFDKADNEFTALAMNIFANFGFQMIVATPLKSVMTLEPFIGGACFIDIRERQISGVLLIEYDRRQKRLQLPERESVEVQREVS